MTLEEILIPQVQEVVKNLYGVEITPAQVQFQKTRAEFEGDITLVVFPFVKAARKAPAQVAQEVGMTLNIGQLLSIPLILLGIYLIWNSRVARERTTASAKR